MPLPITIVSISPLAEVYPLSPGLKELFGHEQCRWDELLQVLRDTFQTNKDIHAAWYYGSVARGEDEPHSDLDIAVIAPDGRVDETVESVRQALREVEDRLYISCSIVGLSPSDVMRLRVRCQGKAAPSDVARLSGGDDWWQNMARDAKVLKGVGPEPYAATLIRQRMKA